MACIHSRAFLALPTPQDEQLNELGGKPEVIESMFAVRLHTMRQRTATEEDTGLDALQLDEYKLDPFEHGTCIAAVRLFDER